MERHLSIRCSQNRIYCFVLPPADASGLEILMIVHPA